MATAMGTWQQYVHASTAAIFQAHKTSFDVGLRLLDAAYSSQRRSLEAWLAATEQTQQQVEHVLGTWANEADSALAEAQRESQRTANRIKREAERTASQAAAALEQEQQPAPITVIKREDDWAVMREDAQRPSRVFDTKREAVERAREIAKNDGAEVRIENGATSDSGDGGSKPKSR